MAHSHRKRIIRTSDNCWICKKDIISYKEKLKCSFCHRFSHYSCAEVEYNAEISSLANTCDSELNYYCEDCLLYIRTNIDFSDGAVVPGQEIFELGTEAPNEHSDPSKQVSSDQGYQWATADADRLDALGLFAEAEVVSGDSGMDIVGLYSNLEKIYLSIEEIKKKLYMVRTEVNQCQIEKLDVDLAELTTKFFNAFEQSQTELINDSDNQPLLAPDRNSFTSQEKTFLSQSHVSPTQLDNGCSSGRSQRCILPAVKNRLFHLAVLLHRKHTRWRSSQALRRCHGAFNSKNHQDHSHIRCGWFQQRTLSLSANRLGLRACWLHRRYTRWKHGRFFSRLYRIALNRSAESHKSRLLVLLLSRAHSRTSRAQTYGRSLRTGTTDENWFVSGFIFNTVYIHHKHTRWRFRLHIVAAAVGGTKDAHFLRDTKLIRHLRTREMSWRPIGRSCSPYRVARRIQFLESNRRSKSHRRKKNNDQVSLFKQSHEKNSTHSLVRKCIQGVYFHYGDHGTSAIGTTIHQFGLPLLLGQHSMA